MYRIYAMYQTQPNHYRSKQWDAKDREQEAQIREELKNPNLVSLHSQKKPFKDNPEYMQKVFDFDQPYHFERGDVISWGDAEFIVLKNRGELGNVAEFKEGKLGEVWIGQFWEHIETAKFIRKSTILDQGHTETQEPTHEYCT